MLAGVSGGPDSISLLIIAARMRDELGSEITVAHFDHMMRSREEAAEDMAFVKSIADRLGVPVVAGSGDARACARLEKLSLEDAARRIRYRFFAEEARKAGAGVVLLGHTLDDQAETVLLHLLRGAGIEGLAGMRPRSAWPLGEGPDAGRPLLAVRREETERYCRESGVEPRRDPTNDLPVATRNRVRAELLPVLRGFNPRIGEALSRLAEAAAQDVAHLQAEANELWPRVARVEKDRVSFAREDIASLDAAIVARLIRRAVAQLSGSPADIESVHLEGVLSSLGRKRIRISLPHGVTVMSSPGSVAFVAGKPRRPPAIPETRLDVPGSVRVAGWRLSAEIVPAPRPPLRAAPFEAFLDAGRIRGPLTVRSRRPGDRLRPLGLGGEKKVQDILVDARVPAEERDGVPVVADGQGIVWVAGHCIDERVALGPGLGQAVHLVAEKFPNDA